jgi:hypothetical protein
MATLIQCLILTRAKRYRHRNFILKHGARQESERSPTSPARKKKKSRNVKDKPVASSASTGVYTAVNILEMQLARTEKCLSYMNTMLQKR